MVVSKQSKTVAYDPYRAVCLGGYLDPNGRQSLLYRGSLTLALLDSQHSIFYRLRKQAWSGSSIECGRSCAKPSTYIIGSVPTGVENASLESLVVELVCLMVASHLAFTQRTSVLSTATTPAHNALIGFR